MALAGDPDPQRLFAGSCVPRLCVEKVALDACTAKTGQHGTGEMQHIGFLVSFPIDCSECKTYELALLGLGPWLYTAEVSAWLYSTICHSIMVLISSSTARA